MYDFTYQNYVKLTKNFQTAYIRWFELNVLIATKLLKISDMYNLLLIFIDLN